MKLIKQITNQIEKGLKDTSKPHKSLRGLWRSLDISDKDIRDARQEMWQNFPKDI